MGAVVVASASPRMKRDYGADRCHSARMYTRFASLPDETRQHFSFAVQGDEQDGGPALRSRSARRP